MGCNTSKENEGKDEEEIERKCDKRKGKRISNKKEEN